MINYVSHFASCFGQIWTEARGIPSPFTKWNSASYTINWIQIRTLIDFIWLLKYPKKHLESRGKLLLLHVIPWITRYRNVCLQRYKKSFLWFNQDRSEVSSFSILTSDLCSEHTFLFCYRNCHHGLKWHTTVEQNRFSVHTNTIIHGRSLFPGSSCEPLLPPLAISTNKHLFPRSVQNRSRKHTIISKNWNRFLLN